MKDITKITYLLLGLMLSVPLAAQKTYYMDPEGSDSNPGTSDKPFATLLSKSAGSGSCGRCSLYQSGNICGSRQSSADDNYQ